MNKQTEALKLALEALKELRMLGMNMQWHDSWLAKSETAITAIREALAEQPAQKQEPVANISIWHKNGEQYAELWNWDKGIETLPDGDYNLYTTPPQRKPWVGLDEEEIEKCCFHADSIEDNMETWKWTLLFYEAVATKLREKNA